MSCRRLSQSLLGGALLVAACWSLAMPAADAAEALPPDNVMHVPWSRQAVIYEVNLRQYTPQGTIEAFSAHLPRLKAMGVDILWLMPVHPIGIKQRKGTLGSYYAVRDYQAVNPEFGEMADLRDLVQRAHGLGMKVILDWVANHTAWDHPWVSQHRDWYKKNAKGEIYPVTFGEGEHKEEWTDVVALDYTQPGLRQAMIGRCRSGSARSTSMAFAATSPAWCRCRSGATRAKRWTRSSRSSCWPSGTRRRCMTARST